MCKLMYWWTFLNFWFLRINGEVNNERPKMKTSGGDLIFETAYNKNFFLRTNGPKSTIILGNFDIQSLINVTGNDQYIAPVMNHNTLREEVQSRLLKRLVILENFTANLENNFKFNITRLGRTLNVLNNGVQTLPIIKNKCLATPCQNGGTCLNLGDSYHCLCPTNWKGTNCEIDVNECTNYAGTDLGCQNGATCINTPGSYECLCRPGWYGVDCSRTVQNCSQGDFEMCGHGICIPVKSGEGIKCICHQGWRTDGKGTACLTDVNECEAGQGVRCSLNPRVECINVPGSFQCGPCPIGYTGDGFSCHDIDECVTMPNGHCSISPMVSCHNTIGSRICGFCPPGYIGDGITCTWESSCASGGCHPSAQCVETVAGRGHCVCPPGMDGDGIGIQGCYVDATNNVTLHRCKSNPCVHGYCYPLRNGYTCICKNGFGGVHCDKQSNFCTSNPCKNGGTCRLDEKRKYRCECTALYSGDHCQIKSKPCGGILDYEEGSIVYPTSNTTYSHNSKCAWVIHTAHDKVINVTFSKFNLEYDSDCLYDFVQIHDGRSSASQLIGRFCGTNFPKGGNIISSHNYLYFWFRSDQSVASHGFSLHWTSVSPVCGGDINAITYGHIRSPGSPGPYPQNRDCFWHLSTTLGKRIQLHFFELDIEVHANCSFDFLAIYDGSLTIDPLINKYCNLTQPAPIQSSGSDILIHFHSDGYGHGKGFQITYATIEGVPGCGGLFTNDGGDIMSPSYNGPYLSNLICEYKIKTSPETRIRIVFKYFNLEKSFKCKYDFLKIYDGPSTDSRLVGRFCGKKHPNSYTSSSNSLFILFKADFSMAAEGFKITYESICLKTFTADSGIIKTPGYPINYKHNLVCNYIISSKPGKAIVLTFQDFDIEDNRYYDCQYDHVEIRNGHTINSTLLGRYCGGSEATPPTQISSHNYMYIMFRSDMSISGRGFYANYTTIDIECGGIYRENSGIINYPKDNLRYKNRQFCTWMLIAPEGMHIQLTWNRFNLEYMPLCRSDYVQISEIDENSENNTSPKYCGSSLPPASTISSNGLMIKFVSDASITFNGFSLSYLFLDEKTHCGGYYIKPHGYIFSPGWPQNYEPNRDCVWIITAAVGQQIILNITDFNLEPSLHNRCDLGDYLTIKDGSSENSTLIGTFCGYFKSKRVIASANNLYIKFHSDFYLSGTGFKIEWDGTIRGCGGTLTSAYGTISSPNYPENYNENAECFYRIVTSKSSRIRITFIELDLEITKDCEDDYVEIFDGFGSSSLSLGKYCHKPPKNIETSNNYAFIKFRSDIFMSGKGFQFNYNTICNNSVSGSYGVIESPGFPETYPLNINCLWTITVPKGNKINATFTQFDLFSSYLGWQNLYNNRSCRITYLQYKEKSSKNFSSRICGTSLPQPISTVSNSLQIYFITGNYFPRNGFRLEWISYGCGGHIQKSLGTLSMDNQSIQNLPTEIECEWLIETPLGTAVSITFSEIYMADSNSCSMDALELYNGQSVALPLITKICNREGVTVHASSNFLLVRLVKKSSLRNIYFNSNFAASNEGCGGKIIAPTGVIQSRNYPKNYEDNIDCIWLLAVPKNHRILLTFESFDLYSTGSDDDCGDSIKIYDGFDILSNFTSLICPKSNVSQVLSAESSIKVQFKTDNFGTAKGFKANYTMTCGAVIKIKYDGIISYNNFMKHNNKNCTWVILAPDPSDKIKFTIQQMSIPKTSDIITNRNCPSSYLRILEGNDDKAPIIDEYCGRKIPPMIVSHGSALTIVFASYTNNITGYFSAHYSILANACGGILTSEEGSIASPNYPLSYPNNANCEWILKTSPGNRVYITFENFDLSYSENCNDDYLEIRENNRSGELLEVYCGHDVPLNTTTSTKLYIKFHSDDNDAGQGFVLHYGFVHGNEITGESNGEISSPLYPFPYEEQGEYYWKIITKAGTTISLSIDHLEIHKNYETCTSKLLIYDGYDEEATIIQELCGLITKNENKEIQTTSNIVLIKLILDDENIGSLFHIKWIQLNRYAKEEKGKKINCGFNETVKVIPGHDIIFNSPNYPDDYNTDSNCVWIFETAHRRHLRLSFQEIALQETSSCLKDYISIFSSTAAQVSWKPEVENLCLAENVNKIFDLASSAMKITFKSDGSISRKGFKATVSSFCGGFLQDKSNVIEVTWFDYNEINQSTLKCNWTVKVRPGRTIKMIFLFSNITNENECNIYVNIRNGESNESPLLSKFCGYSWHEEKSQILSSSNIVSISFIAPRQNLNHNFYSFKLYYEETNIECGMNSALSADHKWEIISSPNYPSVPVPYTECIWTFTGPPGDILRIDFIERFDLEYSEECIDESVEIRDGYSQLAPLLKIACQERPGTVKSSSNTMFIKYSTQIAEPRNGFKANISIDICGGTIIAKSGEIRSPGYPHMLILPENTVCQWNIISIPRHIIQLTFEDINLSISEKLCDTDIMVEEMLYTNNTSELVQIKEFCDSDINDYTVPIESLTNKVIIKLRIGKPSQWVQVSESRGFRLIFNSSKTSCGGQITISEGYLTTPGYPRGTSLRYCRWTIAVPDATRRVRLEILDFDRRYVISVFNDFKSMSTIEELTNHDNFSSIPKLFESTGNKLSFYVYFPKTKKLTNQFKAKFSSDEPALCGGTLHGKEGELQSPLLVRSYLCEWNMQANMDNNVKYNTLSVSIKLSSSSGRICRYGNSKLKIKSDLTNGLTFDRQLCGNNTEVTYNIPAANMNINAVHIKLYPLTFHLNWKLHPCGGVVHAEQDEMNVFNIPRAHNITIDCAWLLITPIGVRMELKLEGSFNLDCSDEYVQIYHGLQQDALKIEDFCKDNLPIKPLEMLFKYTYIQYHSKVQNTTNIKLMVKTISDQCGGYLTQFDKVFASPNYPNHYKDNQECIWQIHAEPGFRISLKFKDKFAIEETTNCTKDAIIIFDWKDNKYEEIARICGRRRPQPFNSTSNQMKIIFRTNAKTNLEGFIAQWEPICGGTFLAKDTEQFFYSPGYPYHYYPSSDCHYEIKSASNKLIVKFLEFQLEGSYPGCTYDNLTLTLQNKYNYFDKVYCGNEIPPPSYADSVSITFKSDRYTQLKGFKISYILYDCGGIINNPTVLTSDKYAQELNCTWIFEAPTNKVIILKFLYIDITTNYECYGDYLAVYDGSIIDISKRLALMCGNINTTTIIKSVNNKMILEFVSTTSFNYEGFKAYVLFTYSKSVGCGGEIDLETTNTKILESPLIDNSITYENYLDCHWTIKTRIDHFIKINFTSFHIAPCSNDNQTALGIIGYCNCDFVQIIDGINPNSLTIGTYCGHKFPIYEISSSSNLMTVRLSTDGEITSSGFKAFVTSYPSQCGSPYFSISSALQTIKSPGYETGVIPRGLHCSYFLDASSENYSPVHIRIQHLDLEAGTENKCNKDIITIKSASQPLNTTMGENFVINNSNDDFFSKTTYIYSSEFKYVKSFQLCGQKKSTDYYVYGNVNINIQTTAETTVPHRGMEIAFSFMGFCGRNYTELQARIQMVSFTYNINDEIKKDCFTLIAVPENYNISLYFLSVSPIFMKERAYLSIFDGNTTDAPLLIKISKESREYVQVFSSGRYLLIQNHMDVADAITYDLNYIATNKGTGCGGKLHNTAGRVTSPLYPKTYRNKTSCEWELETPVDTRIILHFVVFDLGRICDTNYLSLVDRSGNTISTYCEETPADYTSEDNYVKIVFTTTNNNAGTGWVADFIAIL